MHSARMNNEKFQYRLAKERIKKKKEGKNVTGIKIKYLIVPPIFNLSRV